MAKGPFKMKGYSYPGKSPVKDKDSVKIIEEGIKNKSKEELQEIAKRNIKKGVSYQDIEMYAGKGYPQIDSVAAATNVLVDRWEKEVRER